ncbi:MAG: hypothetical protein N3G80_03825 [Candidatus Micrarchaeota archaeon]|nr:hypothetical protein [Candidatus Micrarchaeota archaeon]
MEGENRLYTVLALAGGFFSLSAALFFNSPLAAAFAAACFFASLLLWKYGYAIVPAITKRTNIIEVGHNFEIPPSQDVIVGKSGWNFVSTAFLAVRFYESASEKDDKEKKVMAEMFERVLSSAGFPFKLSCMVCPLDLRNEIEEAQARRSIAESKLEKLGKKESAQRAQLKREIAMWSRQIEKLSSGQAPLDVVFYISTTASGMTKEEAIARVNSQAEELAVIVSGALGCEVARLKGEEMKKCFWWDFFGPADKDELEDGLF